MSEFNLPATNWEDLKLIIISYSNQKKEATNEEIAKLAGIADTKVSRNNKFLSDNGIIDGGKKKAPTEFGVKLGRALFHEQVTDIRKHLVDLIQSNESLSDLITTLRIQKAKDKKDFINHILYVSGQSSNQYTKAGASCIAEILIQSGLVNESDGNLSAPDERMLIEVDKDEDYKTDLEENKIESNMVNKEKYIVSPRRDINYDLKPSININIQLQLPESENPEVYENLFRSLRKNLIDE